MTPDRTQVLVVGTIVLGWSLLTGLTVSTIGFAILGLTGILFGGWPIWTKIFKRKE